MKLDNTQQHHLVLFDAPAPTVAAVGALREAGYTVVEVYSPLPLEGVDTALGRPETRLPWATALGALGGVSFAVGLQLYVHAVDWPLAIGGKTNMALPAIVPITFELGVLVAALLSALVFVWRSGLGWPRRGRKLEDHAEARVTDDRFAVLVREHEGFAPAQFASLCESLGPLAVEPWSHAK